MLIRTDILRPWRGERIDGVLYPRNIEFLWTVEELAAIKLVKEVPFKVPQGHRKVGAEATWNAAGQRHEETVEVPVPTPAEALADDSLRMDDLLGQYKMLQRVLWQLAKRATNKPNMTLSEFKDWMRGL